MNQKEILDEIERRNPNLYIASFEYEAEEDTMWVRFAYGRRMFPMYEKGVFRKINEAKKAVTEVKVVTRHFFVSYNFNKNSVWGFGSCLTTIKGGEFFNRDAFVKLLKQEDPAVESCVVMNIVELSEKDAKDYGSTS